MPYLRYWLLSEEYNKKAECAAPCFFILWRFRLCFLRKTGTWRDDAFLRAAGAGAAPLERPRPACGRAGVPPLPRISARSLYAQNKPSRAAAFFAAAGPSAAPAGPLPALRPPQAPVFGRFGRGCYCSGAISQQPLFSGSQQLFRSNRRIYPHGRMCTNRLPPALHHKAECSRSP